MCFEVIKKAHALLTCLKRENSNQLNNVNDGKSRAGCHSTQVGIMVRKIATLYKICMAKTEQNAHIVLSIRTTAVKYRYQCKAIYIIENSPHKFTCMRRKWFSFWWIKQTFDDIKKLQFSKRKIVFELFFFCFLIYYVQPKRMT